MAALAPPLVVDLDGTLLHSGLLLESGVAFLRSAPARLPVLLKWLAHGKAALSEGLAGATQVDVSVLPYDAQVIALIEAERERGRHVVLVTEGHPTLAERVAEHLNLFDEVLGTGAARKLSPSGKRDVLVERYGRLGFDYIGNSHDDVPVWAAAREAYVVNPDLGVESRAQAQGNVRTVIRRKGTTTRDWMRALRLHQWTKNALIFVPLLAAHQVTDPWLLWQGVLAFVLFGLCASSVYVLNDLLDLPDDRHHPSKRHRPFAAGRLSITAGVIACIALLVLSLAGAALLMPWRFAGVLATYYALTLAYSVFLKRKMAVDVIALAMLYTLRIVAGAAAFAVPLSFWILAFSMFIFLSLALVKRHSELGQASRQGDTNKTRGRGYYPGDLGMIASLGASSGYLSVMVLALYINDQRATGLYAHPQVIWLACPLLLFWITRVWMLTHRGQMDDDPVVFAIRDRISLVVGALFALVFWAAA